MSKQITVLFLNVVVAVCYVYSIVTVSWLIIPVGAGLSLFAAIPYIAKLTTGNFDIRLARISSLLSYGAPIALFPEATLPLFAATVLAQIALTMIEHNAEIKNSVLATFRL